MSLVALPKDAFQQTFDGVTIDQQTVVGSRFEQCLFRRCSFENVLFSACRFTDCTFEGCDLVGVRFRDCGVIDTVFNGGRAMGVHWVGVRKLTFRAEFKGVRMDYCNFSDLPLRNTVFQDCNLREALFAGAVLSHTRFEDCDLLGADFTGSDLRQADLQSCNGVFINPKTCRLKSTKLSADAALNVLRQLGVQCAELEGLLGWSP